MVDTPNTQYVDDLELPDELPAQDRTWVARIPHIGFEMPPERMAQKRRDRGLQVMPMLHIDWEPLSFKYDFNPEVFTDNPNNYEQAWITMRSNDGRPLGGGTQFGQLFEAFKSLGHPLTKNDVFRPGIEGKIFKVRTVEEKYTDANGVARRSFTTIPVEELATYTPPTQPQVFKRGYGSGAGTGIQRTEPNADAIIALKKAINGKAEDEYTDALFDSGNPSIMCDPFMAEAADRNALTQRLKALGATFVSGRAFFEDVVA